MEVHDGHMGIDLRYGGFEIGIVPCDQCREAELILFISNNGSDGVLPGSGSGIGKIGLEGPVAGFQILFVNDIVNSHRMIGPRLILDLEKEIVETVSSRTILRTNFSWYPSKGPFWRV